MDESTYYTVVAVLTLILALPHVLWLWMFIDCIKNELPGSSEKIGWIVMMLVFGLFGAFAYNISRRKKRIA